MKFTLFCIFIFLSLFTFSHGDLHERIEKVSEEIKKDPKNKDLYLKRGILYHQHNDQKNAEKDFKNAKKLGLDNAKLHYYRAKNYLDMNKINLALEEISINIKRDSADVVAHKLKGEIHEKQENLADAAKEYELVLKYSTKIILTDYFVTIDAYQKAGDLKNAIRLSQIALKNFDRNLGLIDMLIMLYKDSNQKEKALEILSQKITWINRKEFDYVSRAKLYFELGRKEKAKLDLKYAKNSIYELNDRFKTTEAILLLEKEIQELENHFK